MDFLMATESIYLCTCAYMHKCQIMKFLTSFPRYQFSLMDGSTYIFINFVSNVYINQSGNEIHY